MSETARDHNAKLCQDVEEGILFGRIEPAVRIIRCIPHARSFGDKPGMPLEMWTVAATLNSYSAEPLKAIMCR